MFKYTKDIMDTVVLKCESQKTFDTLKNKSNVWELMPSVMTTYSYGENRYRIWTYNKIEKLIKYLNSKNIVCFNGVRFDIPLLTKQKFNEPYYVLNIPDMEIKSVITDIFMSILQVIYKVDTCSGVFNMLNKKPLMNIKSYSLYNLYCNTLNKNIDKKVYDIKTSDLFSNKKILELIEVNLLKLRMIKELYEFVLKNKYVVNGDFDILKIDNIVSPNNVDSDMFLPF
jgi:hypothetical protein